MAEFKVDTDRLKGQAEEIRQLQNSLNEVALKLTKFQVFQVESVLRSNATLPLLAAVSSCKWRAINQAGDLGTMATGLERVAEAYVSTETSLKEPNDGKTQTSSNSDSNTSKWQEFFQTLWEKWGWSGLLKGGGYLSTLYGIASGLSGDHSPQGMIEAGEKIYDFFSKAVGTYKNYKKIGNAVGTETAMGWWTKMALGLKPLGRASTAKNPITRFVNNLTNKTSPFRAQAQNVVDNFSGANGMGKAFASWAGVALTGVVNWFDNKKEQQESGGTMSDARVVAETITETAVGTALSYGANIVVGAAITTVLGTTAAPGILVVALTGLTVTAINVGVAVVTEKTATELISDGILNIAEAAGNAAREASDACANWLGKLLFT